MTNYLQMTTKDIDTLKIIDKVSKREIKQIKASELLWIWERQIRRKIKIYKEKWLRWLIHKSRWKPSNHKHDPTHYEEIIKLKKEKYYDYNITHFCEKLLEIHNIKISMPTLRNELIRNWWEELCLLLAVDDASWKANAKFDTSEGIVPTFNFWKEYIKENWKPRWIYLDKFATYKINNPNATNDKELPTQFWRICQVKILKGYNWIHIPQIIAEHFCNT